MKKLRIAQVAPLWKPVSQKAYSGVELVVSSLTDELVRRGHEVTLFASKDSPTKAKLEPVCDKDIKDSREYIGYEKLQLLEVYEQAEKFDIIHSHLDHGTFPYNKQAKTPTVQTIYYDFHTSRKLFAKDPHQPYVSISNTQQELIPNLNYVRTIYNGINLDEYPFYAQHEEPPYLVVLDSLSADRGLQYALNIARRNKLRLKIAGRVKSQNKDFFDKQILNQIDGKQIEYLGEITQAEKVELLGKAAVTLFPITWQDPFGLVMIESMATGTPVVGFNVGCVPEVIAHGKTGFVCQNGDEEEMAKRIDDALELDRHDCRRYVESRFSAIKMADGYEAVYRQVLEDQSFGIAPLGHTIAEAHNQDGLIDALQFAKVLSFTPEEMARFLGRNSARGLYKNPDSKGIQEDLRQLEALIVQLRELLDGSMENVRTWLSSGHPALGGHTPKYYLIEGKPQVVETLVHALETGQPL